MANIMAFNKQKFKGLVHYICEKASDPSLLGSIKLNKVLYYSDVIFYKIHGESITGESYIKRQYGPVPRHIMPILEELISEKKVLRGKVDHFGFMKNEFIAVTECDKSLFTADEVSFIDLAFEHVCFNHTAKSVSEETHSVIWQLAEMGEEIPYFTTFAANVSEIDETDIAWAESELQLRKAA